MPRAACRRSPREAAPPASRPPPTEDTERVGPGGEGGRLRGREPGHWSLPRTAAPEEGAILPGRPPERPPVPAPGRRIRRRAPSSPGLGGGPEGGEGRGLRLRHTRPQKESCPPTGIWYGKVPEVNVAPSVVREPEPAGSAKTTCVPHGATPDAPGSHTHTSRSEARRRRKRGPTSPEETPGATGSEAAATGSEAQNHQTRGPRSPEGRPGATALHERKKQGKGSSSCR